MLQNLKKRNEGFTIIEVLIVLAIAGLILLIVFLAVPALQRNSRNTQLRNGVSTVLGGVNEFISNNGGKMPTSVTGTGDVTIAGANGTTPTIVKVAGNLVAGTDITVNFGKKCNGTALVNGSARNFAATYNIETSGAAAPQCTEG